jgi:hypothetical protein
MMTTDSFDAIRRKSSAVPVKRLRNDVVSRHSGLIAAGTFDELMIDVWAAAEGGATAAPHATTAQIRAEQRNWRIGGF